MAESQRKNAKMSPEEAAILHPKVPVQDLSLLSKTSDVYADTDAAIREDEAELEEEWENGEITEEEYASRKSALTSDKKSNAMNKRSVRENRAALLARQEATRSAIQSALSFYQQGLDRVESDDALERKIVKYFQTCADEGWLPTFEKLCLFIGYTKAEVNGWEAGTKSGFSDRTGMIVRQAKLALAAIDADMVIAGQMPPTVYRFRSAIFSGMDEKTGTGDISVDTASTKSLAQLMAESADLPGADSGGSYKFEKEKQKKPKRSGTPGVEHKPAPTAYPSEMKKRGRPAKSKDKPKEK